MAKVAKQFINKKEDAVVQSLEGLCMSEEHLNHLDGFPEIKVVVDQSFQGDEKVAIIAGGGAGHEPSFAGYVGEGMLAAAVVGDVFASPPTEAILAAIRQVIGKAGCLVVVINYTGDRLNFGLAVEQAKAEGLNVEMVIIGDDCALPGTGLAGRRGLAGAVLALKIAGAASHRGDSLSDVTAITQAVSKNVGTLGVSASVCTVPGGQISDRLGDEEIEVGLGIHGEPGVARKQIQAIDSIVKEAIKTIVDYQNLDESNDQLTVLVNNLGATSELEMGIITGSALKFLTQKRSFDIVHSYSGTFMTSLDMKGFSISLLKLQDAWKPLLDAPCRTAGWRCGQKRFCVKQPLKGKQVGKQVQEFRRPSQLSDFGKHAEQCIQNAVEALLKEANQLDEWDRRVGDGDCGSTIRRGAEAIQAALKSELPLNDGNSLALSLAHCARSMGGTSGALYNIFFTSAARCLPKSGPATCQEIANSLQAGVASFKKYGGAQVGYRTMLDALEPASDAFSSSSKKGEAGAKAALAAAAAAKLGGEKTKGMIASVGRSSYIPDKEMQGIPDPGAMAVATWMQAVADAFHQ